ncbi:histidine kinase [Oscillospiraceae bacterium HV4-5-C5C]|nr:histidine kinase [Oscillospiraceae bacterium HV4-5-C5C]
MSILPVTLIGVYAYKVYTDSVYSKVSEYAEQSVSLLDDVLYLELQQYSSLTNTLSVMDSVQQLLTNDQKNATTANSTIIQNITKEIDNAALRGINLREVQIISSDKQLLYSTGYIGLASMNYNELIDDIDRVSPSDSLQYISSSSTEAGNLALGRKIYRYHNSQLEPIGYIILYIDARFIQNEIFSNINFGDNSEVYLVTSSGTVLAASNLDLQGSSITDLALFKQLIAEPKIQGGHFKLEGDGTSSLVVYDYSDAYDCYFSATVPQEYLQNETRQITQNLLLLSLLLFVFGLGITMLVYYSIVNPMNNIIKRFSINNNSATNKAGSTLRLSATDDPCQDEVGLLAKTIDDQFVAIQQMSEQQQKDLIRRRELELKSLQYQINPHFLFNTLNSLKWVAKLNNVPVLYNGIEALSSLLQNTLMAGSEFIPLQEELKNLSDYFEIQKIRYGNSFDVKMQVSPEFMNYKIPRLILQPLAENAIVHSTREDVICITISSLKLKNGDIELSISDNGNGFHVDKIKNLSHQFTGIGLSNVDERLKLYYGPAYGLSIRSRIGEGTVVTIQLPHANDSDTVTK